MTTPPGNASESAGGSLTLEDLEIPGHTGPIPSGELGINLAAAKENFPRNGLQLFIPAWGSMGVGDSVQVLLGGEEVACDRIDESEVGQRRVLGDVNRDICSPNVIDRMSAGQP
jgi:hypothetical protein